MSAANGSFFRSRWVDAPAGVEVLAPGPLPGGFRAAGIACGMKPSGRLDLGLLACDSDDAVSAAMFTRNAIVAAPVEVSRRAALARLRCVVVNSGIANVGDGARGVDVARAMVASTAAAIGVDAERVGVASTGVIGVGLDRDTVVSGIERIAGELAPDAGHTFAEAIMTTDRWPKHGSLAVELPGGPVRLCAQAKGAGMISPSFATMLCFVQTDAALDAVTLDRLLRAAVERSFERTSVDGQLSTNDSIFCMASGASGVSVDPGDESEAAFAVALDALLRQLALEIVADGEGAERVARLLVRGSVEAVDPVARAVANSPLVKCALHGGDPNWGRILAAAGQAVPEGFPGAIDLYIEDVHVASEGSAVGLDDAARRRLDEAMKADEVELRLDVSRGGEEAEIFFCDLGHGYVSLNSEYAT
jgi:glutamate N-acetyltransferase / amino-acid N-acetyltransferase